MPRPLTGTLPVLQPQGVPIRHDENPWVVWQPLDRPEAFTCTQCQEDQTGLRFLELTGTEPQIFPVLPRNPAHLVTATREVGRRMLCPACRWAKPGVPEMPKPRKTTLD